MTKNLFWSLKGLELTKFTCSHEQEIAFFCLHFKNNPPQQEAYRQSKSKHSPENYSKIYAILAWWTLLPLRPIRCCCCWSNNIRQGDAVSVSLFFLPLHPLTTLTSFLWVWSLRQKVTHLHHRCVTKANTSQYQTILLKSDMLIA